MKAILKSIKPYYLYCIIAGKKRVECDKRRPVDKGWNRKVMLYCSKDMKSFRRIPKVFRPLIIPYIGKVVCEFICDRIYKIKDSGWQYLIENDIALTNRIARESCLLYDDLRRYLGTKDGYGWHISDLKIYEQPKELSDFVPANNNCGACGLYPCGEVLLKRPPQDWQYVKEVLNESVSD